MKKIPLRKFDLKDWLTIIGGIILFSSWLVEHKFQSDLSIEKEKLKRSQLVIDIEEVQRSLGEMYYNLEGARRPLDSLTFADAQTKLGDCYMKLVTWSSGRLNKDTADYSHLVYIKNGLDKTNHQALKSHYFAIINHNFLYAQQIFNTRFSKLDYQFPLRFAEVESQENMSSWIFLVLYTFGSILIGLGYLVKADR